ncbi:MAG: hypothetical protein M0P95_16420 [Sulfuritalea sp.]|jgi:hypothetical protein|nr:hypothetical protein [Sulfuritalea sp.]
MTTATDQTFGEIASWQSMLDRHRELFLDMVQGSRIGFVSREASGILPGKHLDGVKVASEVPMLAWQLENGGMSARIERFAGMSSTKVDLLLVADEEALETMRSELGGDTLTVIKRLIRRGRMMFFVFKNKAQLQDAGYEDFLDSLGLAFLGACR